MRLNETCNMIIEQEYIENVVFSQPDGLGLGEVGELEVQMFNLAQMPNRIPNAQFSTSAPILPNPCWAFVFLLY
jgi:hypothetical protein